MKVSFKAQPPPTGLSAIGSGWTVNIKVSGFEVGYFSRRSHLQCDGKIHIQIAFRSKEEPKGWVWKFWKFTPKDLYDRRGTQKQGKEGIKQLLSTFKIEDLYFFDS